MLINSSNTLYRFFERTKNSQEAPDFGLKLKLQTNRVAYIMRLLNDQSFQFHSSPNLTHNVVQCFKMGFKLD